MGGFNWANLVNVGSLVSINTQTCNHDHHVATMEISRQIKEISRQIGAEKAQEELKTKEAAEGKGEGAQWTKEQGQKQLSDFPKQDGQRRLAEFQQDKSNSM